MPRYQYECTTCNFVKTYFHRLTESIEVCEKCNEKTMHKVLTNKFYTFTKDTKGTLKTGEVTKKAIEDNREILENQKKEAKEETYDPS